MKYSKVAIMIYRYAEHLFGKTLFVCPPIGALDFLLIERLPLLLV
jgi:hypothetical protein